MSENENSKNKIIISSQGLSKIFLDFWRRPKAKAVNNIDFEVREGEVLGFLGPNGSGKSTTVKMILGLLYPSSGILRVFGQSPRDVATKKYIGYLPEESYLYKYLTAAETLDFFGSLFNLSIAERRSRTKQLLEMVGLSHAANRAVGEFSKGMQRRIGLAQAMINDPDLLILDEPTSGLDPIGCREIKDLIKLLKQRGKTVLITSHLLNDVEDICDRIIILYGGKIRATGSLKELLTVPEVSTITTPQLTPEATEKVISVLREQLQGENFIIDHPKKSLEDFFLEVISEARETSPDTAGAEAGGEIAQYLRQDEEEKAKILEKLTEDESVSPPASDEPEEKDIQLEATKIDELISDEVSRSSAKREKEKLDDSATESREKQQVADSLKKANEKLAELLNDKK